MEKRSSFVMGILCGVCLTLMVSLGVKAAAGELSLNVLTSGSSQDSSELTLNENRIARKLQTIEGIINDYFYGDIDSEQVEAYIYKGLIAGLEDTYAAYYTGEELAQLKESTSGTYEGIGVTVMQDAETGDVTIVQCYENTPAFEAGLQAGDVIRKINQESVDGMDLNTVVSLIKTSEGDSVMITVSRDGGELDIPVERETVEVPTVKSEMLDGNIGYLQITEFDTVTVEQFIAAKEELEAEGMEKLIVDLRDNLGGTLDSVCDILREILPKGLIVYTQDKNGERTEYSCDGEKELQIPMAVLINGYSASASEIFAGAVKDYGIGTLVGTTTYGKGIVQKTVGLSDGSAVKLTIAKYFTPLGNDIHGKGIEPDIEIEAEEGQTDHQLQAAIDALNK